MLLGDRRDDGDVGLDDRAQARDLPWLVRAHLDDGDVGAVRRGEQRQRHADEIVEIAVRGVGFERRA